ncbi:MAG: NAD-dependent epimerase/dehydratase family protein [Actinomycetales bacterium]|nr:NAD-dependent epimerase/dehydratase family protein [Actinomycetales bacterium]
MRIVLAGALGEVGRSVGSALEQLGHEVVPVSSRAPALERPGVVGLDDACALVAGGGIDGVVNASGRGDRRVVERTGHAVAGRLAEAASASGTPSLLLSTTRVLEGHGSDADEAADPEPRTPYAQANADNEARWQDSGGSSIVRIVNYLCLPSAADSPQAGLLPWSLVSEALDEQRITVRATPSTEKEFVDAADVASAVELVLAAADRPAVCATVPGVIFTMRDLAERAAAAVTAVAGHEVAVTFGAEASTRPVVQEGWLAAHGWSARLSPERLAGAIRAWVETQDAKARA